MRKNLLALLLCAFCALTAMADLPFRNHRYNGFKVLEVDNQSIVFVGNSITNMHEWWEAFGNPNIKNRGTSGAVSDEMLANLEDVLSGKPAKVFFLIGTNDLGTNGLNTAAYVANNVRTALRRCQVESPSTKVYVNSIFPSTVGLRTLALEQQTNDSIRKICGEFAGVTYIDLWDDLLPVASGTTLSLDNLHLSATGYQIWCKRLAEYVGSESVYPATTTNNYGGQSGMSGMRNSQFAVLPVKSDDILIIGDGTIHGGEWHELLHSDKVKSRSTSWGYASPGIDVMKAFIENTFHDGATPAQVYLYMGVQEAVSSGFNLTTTTANYKAAVQRIQALSPTTKVHMLSVLPHSNASTNTNNIVPLNAKLKALADELGANVNYVDLYTTMVQGGVANPAYFNGNYLYGMGYIKMAQLLAAQMGAGTRALTDAEATALKARLDARNTLATAIQKVRALRVGTGVGQYAPTDMADALARAQEAEAILAATTEPAAETLTAKAAELQAALTAVLPKLTHPTASTTADTVWYQLLNVPRGNRYVTATGANATLMGNTSGDQVNAYWMFVKRADGNYNIINRGTKTYINPSAAYNAGVTSVAAEPSTGWELSYANTAGTFIIRAGSVELNQTGSPQNYAIYNWSAAKDGMDRADQGCQFQLMEAPELADAPESPVTDNGIFVTTTITDGQFAADTRWYTLQIGSAGLHISNTADAATKIQMGGPTTQLADKDLWCFTGSETAGYRIYNKEAGASKALAAPATMTGTEGGTAYVVLKDTQQPSTYRLDWQFAVSTDLGADVPGYYMYPVGSPTQVANDRNKFLAFWTGGKDAGSTLQILFAKQTLRINTDNGVLANSNGTLNTNFNKTWTSNQTNPQLVLDAGYNNLSKQGTDVTAYVGLHAPQNYTLTANGYSISSYAFDFVNVLAGKPVTITSGNQTMTSTDAVQHFAVDAVTEQPAAFVFSGANNGVKLSNFDVTIVRTMEASEPQEEVFVTPTSEAIPYRIPGIAKAQNGDLIAVADYRHSRADIGMATNGRIDLHLRISKDNGATWGNVFPLVEGKGAAATSDFWVGFGDPAIVADRESGKVLVLSCAGNVSFPSGTRTNHQSIAHFLSTDNGATWSQPIDLEKHIYEQFDNSTRGPVRAMFIGSGKIHQSRFTKVGDAYRLYCAVLVKDVNGTNCNYVLYSDNFGTTWKVLGDVNTPPIPSGADEPKAEELPDGSILVSSRCSGGRIYNIFTFTDSKKAAGAWGASAYSNASNEGVVAINNSCNGEVMVLPVVRKSDNKQVYLALQSLPFGSGRTNVGIYYKALENYADFNTAAAFAAKWDGRHKASRLASAYSTMTLQADDHVGFVYEEDTHGTNGGGYTIVYKNYSIEQITDSAYTLAKNFDYDAYMKRIAAERVEAIRTAVGDCVGMIDAAKMGNIEAALAAYTAAPSPAGYEAITTAAAEAAIRMESGQFYSLRNKLYPTKYLSANASAATYGNATAVDVNEKFCFTSDADGYWTIYNAECGTYMARTQADYKAIPQVAATEAGKFQLTSFADGYSVLTSVNPTNASHPAIHMNSGGVLVSWTNDADASQWRIAPVDAPTGLDDATVAPMGEPNVVYDLQGRRVARPAEGIYIVNGRKRIFK